MITDNAADQALFLNYLHEAAEAIHQTAMKKGWWRRKRHDGELIALVHSELSELLEALRDGDPPDDKIPRFTSAEIEAADVIIRLLDMGYVRGWRIGEAVLAKMEYNTTLRGGESTEAGEAAMTTKKVISTDKQSRPRIRRVRLPCIRCRRKIWTNEPSCSGCGELNVNYSLFGRIEP